MTRSIVAPRWLMTTPLARATACGMGTGPAPMSRSGSDGRMASRGTSAGGATAELSGRGSSLLVVRAAISVLRIRRAYSTADKLGRVSPPPSNLTVVGEIARGGFGRVERVCSPDGRVFARKVFEPSPRLGLPEEIDVEKLRKRFEREVRVQMALAPYGMMPIEHAALDADPPWFLMPLADKTYRQQIRADREQTRVSPEPLLDILNGLEELHRLGYVHRDLKP